MVFKSKLSCICLLVFASFFIFASIASGSTDPELKVCKHQCEAQQETDERKVRECLQSCEDYHREKQEREREKEGGRGGGGGGSGDVFNPESPKERLRVCEQRCERGQKGQQEKQSCRRECQQTYEREREEGGRGGGGGSGDVFNPESPKERLRVCEQRCERGEKGQQEKQSCRRECQQTYEREREEGGRGGGGGSGDVFNPESPKERLRVCEQRCERGEKGEKQSCRRECQQAYERERKGGGSGCGGGGSDDGCNKPESPKERLRVCVQQCDRRQQGQEEKQSCRQQCQQVYEREREREEGSRGGGGGSDAEDKQDPEKEFKRCQKQCQRESEGRYSQDRCLTKCEERRRESEQGHGGGRGGEHNHHHGSGQSEEEEEQQGEQEENPYVFEDQHFKTPIKTEHGRVRVLQKFTDRSKLLRGIENYRITILEAEPQTFIIPNHWDAEIVIFVANGRGTLSLIRSQRRESFNIKLGDIVRIPAGTTAYLINQDNNERLVLAKLVQPVSTPGGDIESFFGAGGENPESFYRAFSNEILEAALNAKSDRIQRIFGQQKQGVILKASREQIRALSHHEEGGIWPFGGESKGTINIFQQRPTQENQYGRLYEVAPEDHRQLEDLEVAVSYMNLTQGAMAGPTYTSKATKISIVVKGEGYFEMACPHLSSQSGSRQGREGGRRGSQDPTYQKVSTPLRVGTVVVIPAGHPFVTVASNNQNLEMVCFEVNARNSHRFALAGQRNVVNQFEREAKELAFGVPAREVDEVFNSQEQEYFFKGPRQQHQGRADA